MKKYLVLASFILSVFIFTETVSAQCPTGYTPMQLIIRVPAGIGCDYLVDLCVKCSPLGWLPGCASVMGFLKLPTNPACLNGLTAQGRKLNNL